MLHISHVKLLLVAWMILPFAMAKTIVTESPLPTNWQGEPLEVAAPVVVPQEWSEEESARKVRDYLAGSHSEKKKIEVLTWWADRKGRPDFLVDLAARCAKAGLIDQSIHWLQRAAREDVCDVAELLADDRFASLKKDQRWPKLIEFLRACEAHWQQKDFYREILTLPDSYDGKAPIPLVIGLHGYGSWPEDFAGKDFQKISNAQNVAFLAVSGRRPLGRNAFMWTESFEKDRQHVAQAIQRSRAHLQVAAGRMVAVGFSQGGQLGAELAASQPDQYVGCISMSPGSRYASGLLDRLKAQESLSKQRYFFSWISGEGSGLSSRVKSWRKALEQKDAICHEYEFPGKGHEWPRNYEDYFAITLQVLLR